jgi:ABC-type Fe3+/spermidine/putrescine transport system ATPase subunit
MIAGFESPDSGSILLEGKNITAVLPQHRGIGMVFQNYALFPHMTAFQNIAFGLETQGVPRSDIRSRVDDVLNAVHLHHKMNVPVPQLSGGEQQRVAVARALVVKPSVLLFDEPLSNLDVALRASTREEIRRLQRATGITTVYVTHDQSEAMGLSDRIAVMQQGALVQAGHPSAVYAHPNSVFVAEFLGNANIMRGMYDETSRVFRAGAVKFPVPAGKMGRPGKTVLAIKPEGIQILPSSEQGVVQAVLVEKEYLGFTTNVLVSVEGVALRAVCLSNDMVGGLTPGTQVGIRLDWPMIAVLEDEA